MSGPKLKSPVGFSQADTAIDVDSLLKRHSAPFSVKDVDNGPTDKSNTIAKISRKMRFRRQKKAAPISQGLHGKVTSYWKCMLPNTWGQALLVAALLFGGIILSVIIFLVLAPQTISGPKSTFRYECAILEQRVQNIINLNEHISFLTMLLQFDEIPPYPAFKLTCDVLVRTRYGQALRAIVYVPYVTSENRTLVEKMGHDFYQQNFTFLQYKDNNKPELGVEPRKNASYYAPVLYIDPMPPTNSTMGIDLAADPRRKLAVDNAISRLDPASTPPLDSVTMGCSASQPCASSMLVMNPIRGAKRRVNGFLVAVYDFQEIMKFVLELRVSCNVTCMSFFLIDDLTDTILYEHHESSRLPLRLDSPDGSIRDFVFIDRPLRLAVMRQEYTSPVVPLTILVIMIIATVAIAFFVLSLLKQNRAIQQHHSLALQEHAKRVRAEQDSLMKSTFLSNMSHELRTPLNGLIGSAELLSRSPLSRAQQDHLHTMEICSRSLLHIINDILDLSKIEAGHMVLDHSPFNLHGLLYDVFCMATIKARTSGIKLEVVIDSSVNSCYIGDVVRLQQVCTNLIDNAIKFTPRGGDVTLLARIDRDAHSDQPPEYVSLDGFKTPARAQVEKDSNTQEIRQANSVNDSSLPSTDGVPVAADGFDCDMVHFIVQDTGIGIGEDIMPLLFQPFIQSDSSTTRTYGGTGLGLAISRKLAQLMHGDTWTESVVGVGSTFHFTACLQHCDVFVDGQLPPNAKDAQGRFRFSFKPAKTILDNELEDFGATEQSEMDEPQFNHVSQKGGHRSPRILLVEDNKINMKVAQNMLRKLGGNVESAWNGLDCLEMCKKSKYDLIFLDIQMPVCDGFEAIKRLRSEPGINQSTVVVALTANAIEGDQERCLSAGMSDYLSKPVVMDKLGQVLHHWLPWHNVHHSV